jgi:hypothetical protein
VIEILSAAFGICLLLHVICVAVVRLLVSNTPSFFVLFRRGRKGYAFNSEWLSPKLNPSIFEADAPAVPTALRLARIYALVGLGCGIGVIALLMARLLVVVWHT